jgi:uncharacterized protein (TIGR01319 family)
MKETILVAEIGSTTTQVVAFEHSLDSLIFLGRGISETTADQGDVSVGLLLAMDDLKLNLKTDQLTYQRFLACSSAAGGLKMTIHGLVWDMTVKAAKEAALGAGANIRYITAGMLGDDDLREIEHIRPNIILLAGGVDYGEKNTILANARQLCKLSIRVPVIYAGNKEIQKSVSQILTSAGFECLLCDNVYPSIDQLVVDPLRRLIQQVFEKHITEAPGMSRIRELIDGAILPVPAAVNRAAQRYYQRMGPCMVIDIGGATSDVHSVSEDSDRYRDVLVSPEPFAKRTVEGDLGVYKNRTVVANLMKEPPVSHWKELLDDIAPIDNDQSHKQLIDSLTQTAVFTALSRHAGRVQYLYLHSGRKTIATGKDCSDIKTILLTGGALIHHHDPIEMMRKVLKTMDPTLLLPKEEVMIRLDKQYLLAVIGVLFEEYPEPTDRLINDLIARDLL